MTSAVGSRPVVVGVDAGDPASAALAWAADEAVRRGLPLRLVHAVPPSSRDYRGFDEGHYRTAMHEAGEAALGEARLAVEERYSGLDISIVLADGQPGQVICRRAASAEMVVLGTRGLSRIEAVLSTYSVILPVTAQAPCPVVIVRGEEQVPEEPPYVVVGVDGSAAPARPSTSPSTRRPGAGRSCAPSGCGRRRPSCRSTRPPRSRRSADSSTRSPLGRTALHPDVRLTHEVLTGHPVEQLAAASENALALVVGRRGRGGFTGLRLGSVPHGLLHRARCPLVAVPADLD
ncbi:universal stress protein [Kitasatospora arboriphila]